MRTRDGVTLVAEVIHPPGKGRFPVLLERTTESRKDEASRTEAWVRRGYAVVVQECRGRGDSGGEWTPYVHEARDGADAIEWVARQPWSDGWVGMIGGGYAASVQWLAASQDPPALRAIVPQGIETSFLKGDLVLPSVPTLLVSRWNDASVVGTMLAWEAFRRAKRRDVGLMYGPQNPGVADESRIEETAARFLDAVRKRSEGTMDDSRVQVYVTGAERWKVLDGWPSTTSTFETLYLTPRALRSGPGEDGREAELDGGGALFKSAPFASGTCVAGPFELRLFFTCDTRIADLSATLWDLAPDGSERRIGGTGVFQTVDFEGKNRIRTALLRPRDAAHEIAPGHRLGLRIVGRGNKVLTGTVNPSRITFRTLPGPNPLSPKVESDRRAFPRLGGPSAGESHPASTGSR